MDHQCALMPTMHRFIVVMATAMLVWAEVSSAMAQQATPLPVTPRVQPKKPGTSPPTAPPATAQPQSADVATQQFIFSPWTKICGKDGPEGTNARDVCAILTEARVPSGQIAVAASLVEPRDGTQKILRVTLPLGVRLPFGTRIIIDQGTPLQNTYLMCLAGCISDYEAKADLVDKLKKGQTLTVQAINPGGFQISVNIPLMDFAKAYDGPATDQKVLIERERKLEGELERRAEQTRSKVEGQPPQTQPSPSPQALPSPQPFGGQSNDPFTAPIGK
jgi:invasion protein IalB